MKKFLLSLFIMLLICASGIWIFAIGAVGAILLIAAAYWWIIIPIAIIGWIIGAIKERNDFKHKWD